MSRGTATRAPERPAGSSSAAEPRAPWRRPAFRAVIALGAVAVATVGWWWPAFESVMFALEFAMAALLPEGAIESAPWMLLPVLGLAGGLLASISPCVLPLVPLNAAAIGASDVPASRAASLSAQFTLGAVLALSVLGLSADLAGAVFVEHRGPVRLGVGAILVVLGLAQAEIVPLPLLPAFGAGKRLGPVAAGAAFALITTPCASPILYAVLAAAGAQAVPGLSVATMAAFAVGYTALVFAAGVGGGKASRRFRRHAPAVQAGAAALLILAGVGFAISGAIWLL